VLLGESLDCVESFDLFRAGLGQLPAVLTDLFSQNVDSPEIEDNVTTMIEEKRTPFRLQRQISSKRR
jgi:hypothetical protein